MHHSKTRKSLPAHFPTLESPNAILAPAPADSPQKSPSPEHRLPSYGRDIARDASDAADEFVEKFHTHQQGE
jgi:hypothetical protein